MSANVHVLYGRFPTRRKDGTARPLVQTVSVIGGFLALFGLVLHVIWSADADRRAIAALPDGDRQALYAHSRAELEQFCANPPEALRSHCRQQADFLALFPECDVACQALVEQQHPMHHPGHWR